MQLKQEVNDAEFTGKADKPKVCRMVERFDDYLRLGKFREWEEKFLTDWERTMADEWERWRMADVNVELPELGKAHPLPAGATGRVRV